MVRGSLLPCSCGTRPGLAGEMVVPSAGLLLLVVLKQVIVVVGLPLYLVMIMMMGEIRRCSFSLVLRVDWFGCCVWLMITG